MKLWYVLQRSERSDRPFHIGCSHALRSENPRLRKAHRNHAETLWKLIRLVRLHNGTANSSFIVKSRSQYSNVSGWTQSNIYCHKWNREKYRITIVLRVSLPSEQMNASNENESTRSVEKKPFHEESIFTVQTTCKAVYSSMGGWSNSFAVQATRLTPHCI